jgi:hypothetical protein
MKYDSYPESVRKYVVGLSKYGVIDTDDATDRMLMNYLCTQTYDEDYLDSMLSDREGKL